MKLNVSFKLVQMEDRLFALPAEGIKEGGPPAFAVNETAARLLHLLHEETSFEAALDVLEAEYDVERAQLSNDMRDFVSALDDLGLLDNT
ncbi:MAG: PqqD family protein [Oscillospiraceae bacterium]